MSSLRRRILPARRTRAVLLTGVAMLGIATLAACGGTSSAGSTTSAATSAPAPTGLTLKDPWIKAAPNGMTAIFGTLMNPTDTEITVVSGATPVAEKIELHEVVMLDGQMKMRPKTGGFVVPAKGSHELKPGADHIMVMGLTKAVVAGDSVTATLTTSTGTTITITALAKDYAAGNESYVPSGGASSGMGGMGMSSSAPATSMKPSGSMTS